MSRQEHQWQITPISNLELIAACLVNKHAFMSTHHMGWMGPGLRHFIVFSDSRTDLQNDILRIQPCWPAVEIFLLPNLIAQHEVSAGLTSNLQVCWQTVGSNILCFDVM